MMQTSRENENEALRETLSPPATPPVATSLWLSQAASQGLHVAVGDRVIQSAGAALRAAAFR